MAKAKKTSLVFFCDGVCQAHASGKIKAGTPLLLVSDGVAVKLKFEESPFESGVKQISIPVDGVKKVTVGDTTGEFTYKLSCGGACPGLSDDPTIIIL